jgi:hypothetical protein
MDIITYENKSHVFIARLHNNWRLELEKISFTFDGNNYTSREWNNPNLWDGDLDGDGHPDVYEIYSTDGDYTNPSVVPGESYQNCPPVAPMQIVVIKEDNSTTVHLFVLIYSRCVLKFIGDINGTTYNIDTNWHNNGILWVSAISITRLSSTQLLVCDANNIYVYPVNGSTPSSLPIPWAFYISIGKDTPDGPSYIYKGGTWGDIIKHDLDGNYIMTWQGTVSEIQNLTCTGFYADFHGNVFIIDPVLGCVTRYNSSGKFISRWYETASWKLKLVFGPTKNTYGHVSIAGDKLENIFIMDQMPYLYRTKL